jgi:hypothetical protein
MIIVGAGLSGLIAASMLRDRAMGIVERQGSLPNNHAALLRFRSPVVGDAIGIPFRKVRVMKATQPWRNPVADAAAYSMKCTGKVQLRSIVSAAGEVEDRYIAPSDLIERLGRQVGEKIRYGVSDPMQGLPGDCPIISTIPMPSLMDMLGWHDKPQFEYRPGTVITCDLPEEVDFCATIYLPDPRLVAYRASVTDRKLIIEISGEQTNETVLHRATLEATDALGLTYFNSYVEQHRVAKRMAYAKISPIPEGIRKRFMLWASEKHGVYSLGRFATWRPDLLLDDLVNDVRVIERLIANPHESYKHKIGE